MINLITTELFEKEFNSWCYHMAAICLQAMLFAFFPLCAQAQDWKTVDAQTLHDWLQSEPITLANVMSPIECLDHRIKGSRCIPCEEFNKNLSTIPKDKKLVIYCESKECIRSCRSAADAIQEGHEKVYVLEGGMPAWKHEGFTLESELRVPRVPIQSVKAMGLSDWLADHPDHIILDIRSESSYEKDHLEGAVNIPFYQLHERYHELPWDRAVFVVDDRGFRSFLASCYLARKGFTVVRLFGGMERWRAFIENEGRDR
ncbi:MAG: rhodanese-like domain-containing protein [Deltaproteobacteria bacterium]|nr:rhodanese-like domain-containing protein [Deltaproteobacteria bacterium]